MKVLPRDFQRLLSGDHRTCAIVADMRFTRSRGDVETFFEFVHERMEMFTEEDRQELIDQAHQDAKNIKADHNFGTEYEGTNRK